MKAQFIISASVIIFDQNKKVLLCHRRDYDLWNLPHGGVEKGESPWDAAVREAKEETRLDIEITKLMGIYSIQDRDEVVFSFLAKIIGGTLTLNDEADRLEYFAIDEIPHNTSPKQVERIKDALQGNFVYKTQEGKSSIELIKEGKL